MKSPRNWWLAALVACSATLAACDSNPGDPLPPDDTGDHGDNDETNVEAPPNSVDLGGLCNSDVSCKSAFCVKIGQGFNEGICTKRCESGGDCDEASWDCVAVSSGSGDEVSACIPSNLCIDKDGDNYGVGPGCLGLDCDDNAPSVNPGAPELCNGIDDNCDGIVDNNLVDTNQPCDTGRPGECADGSTVCDAGTLHCEAFKQPSVEICDGLDNDCDGLIDETEALDENGNFVKGIGVSCIVPGIQGCAIGERICDPDRGGIVCVRHDDPNDQRCNGIDDNCDGVVDSGVEGLGEVCYGGHGICRALGVAICDPTDALAPPICDTKGRDELATEEVCDFEDNNCDGVVDEGFVDENGKYSLVEHCSTCNNNCLNLWQPSPEALHVVATCEPVGGTLTCGYRCEVGWYDADGDESNGCELKPDADAIYVSTQQKGGQDSATCGAWNTPCATITKGLERAGASSAKRVLVAEGIYREGVALIDGIAVLGGHNSLNWTRSVTENTTVIFGAVPGYEPDSVGVVARSITKPTEFSGFTVSTPDGLPGGNSIALLIRDSTSALVIKDNVLLAGFGGQGTSGASGANGTNGAAGKNGDAGKTGCSNLPSGGAGGTTSCGGSVTTRGGAGAGAICSGYGEPGAAPQAGQAVSGGGAGGTAGKTAYTRGGNQVGNSKQCLPKPSELENSFPVDGGQGSAGANGSGGAGGVDTNGSIVDGMWRGAAGKEGSAGQPGGGGGGGGASHGVKICTGTSNNSGMSNCDGTNYVGSGGGGGGAGGCAGALAAGGSAGGGSFGLLVSVAGANGSMPTIKDNAISRNNGGQGGDGGIGGSGGFGGTGGIGGNATYSNSTWNYCAQNGRRGGDGGRGGHGGGGGGGAGGNSYDIVVIGASSSQATSLKSANRLLVPESENLAGPGGPGGGSMGNVGANGASGASGAVKTY